MISMKKLALLLILTSILSCTTTKEEPYFEGELTLSESRGLYGSLFKVHTTYTFSENYLKREQKLGGLNSVFNVAAGIVINLEKDSVVVYYTDKLNNKKNKHTTTVSEFISNLKYKQFPNSIPSPVDHTFKLLPDYKFIKKITDSTSIKNFNADYFLYKDASNIFKQEVFSTKDIKVKRQLLDMVFINFPKELNFPLKTSLKTTISDISNDSLVNNKQSKAIDKFLRDVFKTEKKQTDLKKLSKNSWLNLGLKLLKTGVDLNINVSSELSDLTIRKTSVADFSLSFLLSGFEEIDDIDDFFNELPIEGGYDFDD